MDLQRISGLVLILIAIVQCESKTDIGDYIVDCSACNSVPVQGISSYKCKVRCDLQGDVSSNLKTLYDVVTRLSQQLENMTRNFEDVTKEVEETKKKLNATEEKLKTEVVFSARLNGEVSFDRDAKLIFNNINSNVGDGYDSTSGIFTVPYNGPFELTLTTMGKSSGAPTNIMRADDTLCQALSKGASIIGICTSRQNLIEGDQIWLKSSAVYMGSYCLFSGHLISLD